MSVLLCLLFTLVEVYCHTFPYVSFMGNNLSNHSYVNLSLVGRGNSSKSVQCHTDLPMCCSRFEGDHRGDWYFPNSSRLPFWLPSNGVYENRLSQRVDMGYTGSGGTSGIYRCDIEIYGTDGRKTVYVGLYSSGGELKVHVLVKYFACTESILSFVTELLYLRLAVVLVISALCQLHMHMHSAL